MLTRSLFLGYINLSDACLSNTDLSLSQKLPRPLSERKHVIAEKESFDHGSAIFHCQPQHRNLDISDINPADLCRNDVMGKSSSGRQSRFEHCDNYCSNLDQYASTSHIGDVAEATAFAQAERTSSFDFQSEENLFNMNFDSFYEDFSTAELSWSSTTSSSSTASCESNSVSSLYEKNFKIFPKIELEQEFVESKTLTTTPKQDVLEEKKEDSVQLRCFQCNKKLGIIMVMKCHCQKYFCTAHRYKEVGHTQREINVGFTNFINFRHINAATISNVRERNSLNLKIPFALPRNYQKSEYHLLAR